MPDKPGFGHICIVVMKEASYSEIRKKDHLCSEIKFNFQCNPQKTLAGENYTEHFSSSLFLKRVANYFGI